MIEQSVIDRIKESCDIVASVSESVKLTRKGRTLTGLCPFHKEKTPSFNVSEDRGFYHCFGCGAHGDVIKFVQDLECLTFVEAVRRLGEKVGILIDEAEETPDAEEQRSVLEVTEIAARFYEDQLLSGKFRASAIEELARRGIATDNPVVADFRLGYAPYSWDDLTKHLLSLGFSPEISEKAGLISRRKQSGDYYDRFRHLLMCSIIDTSGKVIGFSGRALPEPNLEGTGVQSMYSAAGKESKYINSPETPCYSKKKTLFGLYQSRAALRSGDRCVLVEGNFDVISLHANGITCAVAPLGTAFTPEQAKLIRRFSREITLMLDADKAGRAATEKSRVVCDGAGLITKVASLPDGMDPDDLVRSGGQQAVLDALSSAKGIVEHVIDSALEQFKLTEDAKSKSAVLADLGKALATEPDPVARSVAGEYADRAISALGITEAKTFKALSNTIRRELSQRGPDPSAVPIRGPQIEVIGALLDFPELLEEKEVVSRLSDVDGDAALAVAGIAASRSMPKLEFAQSVLSKTSGQMYAFVAERSANPRIDNIEDAKLEIVNNLGKVRTERLYSITSELERELQVANGQMNFELELELLRRIRETNKMEV